MKIAGIPRSVITANAAVIQELAGASASLRGLTSSTRGLAAKLEAALEAASAARQGAANLGSANLLDASFSRMTQHGVRELKQALVTAGRKGPIVGDSKVILDSTLNAARRDVRLALEAGERSLANPRPRAVAEATSFVRATADDAGNGPAWVDGEWLDALGYPTGGPGGRTWAGPDGIRYGGFDGGSPVSDAGVVHGPDGATFVGI